MSGQADETFWPEYERLTALLFSPLTPDDGIPEEEVAAAERRLGIRLPRLLRDFYLRAGRHALDMGEWTQDSVLPLGRLYVEDGRLVYFASCQYVTFGALPLGNLAEYDPPSYQIENSSPPIAREGGPLSEFLLGLLLWQSVSGAMTLTASEGMNVLEGWEGPPSSDGWERLEVWGGGWPFFVRPGQAVHVAVSTDLGSTVNAGARTTEDAEAISAALGVELFFMEAGTDEGPYLSQEEQARLVEEARERQQVKSQTPYGEVTCVECGRPLRVWADSARNVCGFCGSAI